MKRERLQRKINKIIPTTQCIAYVKQWPNKAKSCDIDFRFVKTKTTVTESMPIKASEKAKSMGLKSLNEVSEMTGQTVQTLINWDRDRPELFRLVLIGCATDKLMVASYQ